MFSSNLTPDPATGLGAWTGDEFWRALHHGRADCHGAAGQGTPGIYPPLAGNRTVTMANPHNLLQAITSGGFPPATTGNPRPDGMPAFDLPPDDLAALASWLRNSWGHQAAPVSAVQALLTR